VADNKIFLAHLRQYRGLMGSFLALLMEVGLLSWSPGR